MDRCVTCRQFPSSNKALLLRQVLSVSRYHESQVLHLAFVGIAFRSVVFVGPVVDDSSRTTRS